MSDFSVASAADSPGVLELVGISLGLKGQTLIEDLNLKVRGGEICVIMGDSGAGKSSLLACVMGVLDGAFEVSGEVRLNGRDLGGTEPERRQIGVCFQDTLLFPHLNVLENIQFGVPGTYPRPVRKRKAEAMLEKIEMTGFAKANPLKLSGGQQARVALMRTLASEPRALMLDEPFSKLDEPMRVRIGDFVRDTVAEYELPTLMVSHDQRDAERLGNQIIRLSAPIS